MSDLVIGVVPLGLMQWAVAAVWLYEGLWSKLLGGAERQVEVVRAVPLLGPLIGLYFLKVLGVVEVAIGLWVLSGQYPGWCAVTQTALLVTLNANGLMWSRHLIHDPGGMVVKNAAFLVLAWMTGAVAVGRP